LLSLQVFQLLADVVQVGRLSFDLISRLCGVDTFPLKQLLSINDILVELLDRCLHLVDTLTVLDLHLIKVLYLFD